MRKGLVRLSGVFAIFSGIFLLFAVIINYISGLPISLNGGVYFLFDWSGVAFYKIGYFLLGIIGIIMAIPAIIGIASYFADFEGKKKIAVPILMIIGFSLLAIGFLYGWEYTHMYFNPITERTPDSVIPGIIASSELYFSLMIYYSSIGGFLALGLGSLMLVRLGMKRDMHPFLKVIGVLSSALGFSWIGLIFVPILSVTSAVLTQIDMFVFAIWMLFLGFHIARRDVNQEEQLGKLGRISVVASGLLLVGSCVTGILISLQQTELDSVGYLFEYLRESNALVILSIFLGVLGSIFAIPAVIHIVESLPQKTRKLTVIGCAGTQIGFATLIIPYIQLDLLRLIAFGRLRDHGIVWNYWNGDQDFTESMLSIILYQNIFLIVGFVLIVLSGMLLTLFPIFKLKLDQLENTLAIIFAAFGLVLSAIITLESNLIIPRFTFAIVSGIIGIWFFSILRIIRNQKIVSPIPSYQLDSETGNELSNNDEIQ